jgi:hypothetical protein
LKINKDVVDTDRVETREDEENKGGKQTFSIKFYLLVLTRPTVKMEATRFKFLIFVFSVFICFVALSDCGEVKKFTPDWESLDSRPLPEEQNKSTKKLFFLFFLMFS